jgi:hypothetical protein
MEKLITNEKLPQSWTVIPPGYEFEGAKFRVSNIELKEDTLELGYDLELEDESLDIEEVTLTVNTLILEAVGRMSDDKNQN